MKSIADMLVQRAPKEKAPPHEHAASVNAIVEFMAKYPNEQKRPRGYWDRKAKGASYGDVLAILKKAGELPAKYTKGGFITNRLSELGRAVSK